MIGLLNAYRLTDDAPDYQLEYGPMCIRYLQKVLPGQEIKNYEVALGQTPQSVDECEAWVITGSSLSAYEEVSWIQELGRFVVDCYKAQQKMIGICFGHQLIAHYLGGRTEKAPGGWGVGVRSFRVVKQKSWMQPELGEVSLLFSHQDQVVQLPPQAELLGTDEFCTNQLYCIGEHVLSLQGHPEFTPEFAKSRLDTRIERVGQVKYDEAIPTLSQKTHSLQIGEWMRKFIFS